MKIQLTNDQKNAIRNETDSILRSRLRGWLQNWGTSETAVQKMMQEMVIGLWMTFKDDLPTDTRPFRKDGENVGDKQEIIGLQLMATQAFTVLDSKLAWVERNKATWSPPERVLWHDTAPKLEGIYAPHVARRVDLEVGSMRHEFFQAVTNTRYVANQDTLRDILAYRDTLPRERANSIMYEREADMFGDLSHNEDRDSDLFEGLLGVTTPGSIVMFRQDEPGRAYAMWGPQASRFLRATLGFEPEELTEEGAFHLRSYLTEKYGEMSDGERDSWAKKIDENGLQTLIDFHKDGADMLGDARGWKQYRTTGSTSLPASRDYVAQGLGLIAALMGHPGHHAMVDISHPKHQSAHQRMSLALQGVFHSLRSCTLKDLKPISKGCLLPGGYGGGKIAIAAKLSDMEWDEIKGDWNYGESGDRLPDFNPIIADMLPSGSVEGKMKDLVKLSARFARAMHHTFPFLKPFQKQVVRNWTEHRERGVLPTFTTSTGYEIKASPIRMNRKYTRSVRCRNTTLEGRTIQAQTTIFHHDENMEGTDWMAKGAFIKDSSIMVHTGLDLVELGCKNQDHVHDMVRVGFNHMGDLDRAAVRSYNHVMGTSLPETAKLLDS